MIKYAPFTVKQAEYIRCCQSCWLNVAEGGKRAGKNIINLVAWAAALDTHPDKIHLAAGTSVSAAKMNILDSNGFGLKAIFDGRCREGKYQARDCLFIQSVRGQKIVLFAGGKKADDAARIKGNSYGTVYITEVNECHETFVKECIDRTLASNRRQVFFDLNPKPPSHWFYHEFLDYQDKLKKRGENPGYNYEHFTILDNLSLSNEQLRTELAKYDQSSIWFQSDIQGLRTSARGRIYDSYVRDQVAVRREWIAGKRFIEMAVGVDVGGTDATCATLTGITSGWRDVVHIDGLYHKQGISEKMTEARYARAIAEWLKPWTRIYPQIANVYVDNAAKLFRAALREELSKQGMGRIAVIGTDKSDGIRARIELVCMLLMQGRYHVAEHLAPWHEALQMATWDEAAYEKGEWMRLDNGSYPVDALDSSEYSIYPYAGYLATVG